MKAEAVKHAVDRARGKGPKSKWFWLAAPVLLIGAGVALFSQRDRIKKIVKH
jgi:hypothetical protein